MAKGYFSLRTNHISPRYKSSRYKLRRIQAQFSIVIDGFLRGKKNKTKQLNAYLFGHLYRQA
jgi:hypothetical protein